MDDRHTIRFTPACYDDEREMPQTSDMLEAHLNAMLWNAYL